jgi:hypothetical protein
MLANVLGPYLPVAIVSVLQRSFPETDISAGSGDRYLFAKPKIRNVNRCQCGLHIAYLGMDVKPAQPMGTRPDQRVR